jgi:gliding motility-associated-like protein
MEKIYILLFVLFTPFTLIGQDNLFSNAGFEEFTECYNAKTKEGSKLVKSWGRASYRDTFSLNPCDTVWHIYLNAIESRSGDAVQYFLGYYNDPRAPADSRTYLISELKKTLQADRNYYFKMYMKCIYNNPVNYCFSNGQAIAFSETIPKSKGIDNDERLDLTPKVENQKLIDTAWTLISGCFKAKGGEKYAIIGNFKTKEKTLIKRIAEPTKTTTDPNAPDFVAGLIDKSLTGANLVDDVELLPLSLEFPKDTAICQGETLVLNVKNNLKATYKWQDGSTSPQYNITQEGIYTVKIDYTIDNNTCSVEQSFKVKVLPKALPKRLIDTVLCDYKDVLLKVGTGRRDDTIKWQNSSNKDTLRVSEKGHYEAKITNACGTYFEEFNVNFAHCVINIFVPNAFSPNGDNINDVFIPYVHAEFPIVEYEFGIYNQWGIEVFSSKERDVSWDGLFKSVPVENGIYVWYLKVKGKLGNKMVQRIEGGDVMLIR